MKFPCASLGIKPAAPRNKEHPRIKVMPVLYANAFDIDVIISRTLVYAALTAIVIGLYVVIVGYLGAIFRTDGNLVISLVATGIVAVLFQPLRGLLQQGVNHLLFGERDTPYHLLARLDRQIAQAMPLENVLQGLVKTIATTLKLPYVAVALIQSDAFAISEEQLVAVQGQLTAQALAERLPIIYQGETIGQLALHKKNTTRRNILLGVANKQPVSP